jgi:hypothetical protein
MTNTEVWPAYYYSAALHSNYSSHDIPGCHRTHKGPEHLFRVVCIPSTLYTICSFLRLWDVANAGPQTLDAISIKKIIVNGIGLGLWCLTPLSITFQLYHGGGNRVPTENHRPAANHWQTITYCYIEYTLPWVGFELTPLVVIGTGFVGSCISNYIRSRPRWPLAMIGKSSGVILKTEVFQYKKSAKM